MGTGDRAVPRTAAHRWSAYPSVFQHVPLMDDALGVGLAKEAFFHALKTFDQVPQVFEMRRSLQEREMEVEEGGRKRKMEVEEEEKERGKAQL